MERAKCRPFISQCDTTVYQPLHYFSLPNTELLERQLVLQFIVSLRAETISLFKILLYGASYIHSLLH